MSRRPLFPPVFSALGQRVLYDDFEMRAARHQARSQPAGIPIVYALPLRSHPMWDGNNELGRQLSFDSRADNTQVAIKLETWGPPKVWSVMLGLSFDSKLLSGTNGFSIVAHVEAGAGGAVQEFEVDWADGTTFSCVMNAATITAVYDRTNDIPSDLVLRATAGERPLSSSPPVRSYRVGAGPSLSSDPIRIPPFARNVVIQPAGGTVAALAATTLYEFGRIIGVNNTQLFGSQIAALGTGNRLEIENGIRFITVRNTDAGSAVNVLLTFELGL